MDACTCVCALHSHDRESAFSAARHVALCPVFKTLFSLRMQSRMQPGRQVNAKYVLHLSQLPVPSGMPPPSSRFVALPKTLKLTGKNEGRRQTKGWRADTEKMTLWMLITCWKEQNLKWSLWGRLTGIGVSVCAQAPLYKDLQKSQRH